MLGLVSAFITLFYLMFWERGNGQYVLEQIGELVISDQFNSVMNLKVLGQNETFNMEIENLINFPVYCLPFSAIDYHSRSTKRPVYFIKNEFEGIFHLYKNNVRLMPIEFEDKNYIAQIAVNNGVVLMITDIRFYYIDTAKKELVHLSIWNKRNFNLENLKDIFFSTLIAGPEKNVFLVTAINPKGSFILYVKLHIDKKSVEILNVIERIGMRSLGMVNGLAVTSKRLYISEAGSNIIMFNIGDNYSVDGGRLLFILNDYKIITLSAITVNGTTSGEEVDYLLVNSKKWGNNAPSSENVVHLLKIVNDKVTDVVNVVDLFSRDVNLMYFDIYDIYFVDINYDQKEGSASSNEAKVPVLMKKKKKDESEKKNHVNLKVMWTNSYNCNINTGFIDVSVLKKSKKKEDKLKGSDKKKKALESKMSAIESKGMVKIPFSKVQNHLSLAPHVTSISHCITDSKVFKSICYYSSEENSVSVLNKDSIYNTDFMNNFYFDGYKSFLAFDFVSFGKTHFLTYPYNDSLYVYTETGSFRVNLAGPFGMSIDKTHSTDEVVTVYIAGNDQEFNYVYKCVVNIKKNDFECFDNYKKERSPYELFYYISYISYTVDQKENTYMYVTNNSKTIYILNKIGEKKWRFNVWFNLENPADRIGPVSTSVNYFFVKNKVLDKLIAVYPQVELLRTLKKKFEEERLERQKRNKKPKKENPTKEQDTNEKALEKTSDSDSDEDEELQEEIEDEEVDIMDDESVNEEYTFLTTSHTIIYCVNRDAYGLDSGSTIHFYASILKEKFYQVFAFNSIIYNITNEARYNYFIN